MSNDVDPRYDPQFQRGFRGSAALSAPIAEPSAAREPRVPPPSRAASPEAFDTRADGLDRRDPPASAPPPIVATAPVLVERPLTANPLVWGLLVVGVALVVAAIVTFTGWSSLAGGPTQELDYSMLQFFIQVTPVLLGLGGATLLGVGFLFAIDRQRRTRMPVGEPPADPWGR